MKNVAIISCSVCSLFGDGVTLMSGDMGEPYIKYLSCIFGCLSVIESDIRMQETAKKQKRISLKTVHQMLDGMSVELAEKVHLLFMANYIDFSDYDFYDEDQVETYCWCYRDLFELKTKESQEIVNSQVIEFLDEWRQYAPSLHRKAKDDIYYWITDEWYSFESPMQKEIEATNQAALKKKDGMAIALALSPFAQKTA